MILPAARASGSRPAQIQIDSKVSAALAGGPPTQWLPRGPGGGGALFAPSFSPFNPNELYISCDMSEVFHTTNLGTSWDLYDFRQIQGNRESQMRFTSNPSIIFSIDYTNDAATPTKSTDAGITWHQLSADPTAGEAYTVFTDPNSSTRLIVSDYSHIYLSTDGGSTFASKFSTASGNGCFVGGAFFDGNNIYAGTNQGLLTSANNGTFTVSAGGIPSGQSIVSFAGAKQGATIRFFCVTLSSADVFPGLFTEGSYFSYLGVYSIDVGQPNWTSKVTSQIIANDFPFFVAMSRTNINTAYLAGQNSGEFPIVYKTTNGGTSWSSVLLTSTNQNIYTGWDGNGGDRDWSYGAGALGFAVSPLDANKLAFTDLGFSHLSTDGGATWKQMYVSPVDQNPLNALTPKGRAYHGVGLEDTTCWWLTWKDANNMFASYSDIKGTRSTDGGASWSFNYSGQPYNSTYQSLKHPTTGTLYAGTSSVHDMYQSTRLQDSTLDAGNGAIKFSTDGGANWQTLHDFVHPVIGIALDPNNSNRMYASVIHSTLGGIYVSNNIQNGTASTWAKVLANPPRTEGHPFNIRVLNDGMIACTYSGRRNSAGTFTASSGVFTSTDGGNTWQDRSASGMLYWTKDLVIDPFDSTQNTWYVGVFSGWGGPPNGLGGLYKSTNRGVSWTRINSLDRVTSCAISPVNPNEMYLTTETNGLWYSNNLNSGSPIFSAVTSYPFRQPERVFFNPNDPNEIWVTSFGNGLRVGNTCGFSLSSSSAIVQYSGGAGSFVVSAASGCGWTVKSNASWIMLRTPPSSIGTDTVNYEVRENFTGVTRSGTVTAAGQNFTILQNADSGCSFLLSPASLAISSAGGTGWFNIVTGNTCAWSATSNPGWVSITSAALGIGNTAISFTVAPNATGVSRKGKITVGGQVFTIKQGK